MELCSAMSNRPHEIHTDLRRRTLAALQAAGSVLYELVELERALSKATVLTQDGIVKWKIKTPKAEFAYRRYSKSLEAAHDRLVEHFQACLSIPIEDCRPLDRKRGCGADGIPVGT